MQNDYRFVARGVILKRNAFSRISLKQKRTAEQVEVIEGIVVALRAAVNLLLRFRCLGEAGEAAANQNPVRHPRMTHLPCGPLLCLQWLPPT